MRFFRLSAFRAVLVVADDQLARTVLGELEES